MNQYKCLKNQIVINGEYSLVPIRFEDRYDIMQWRNEQIFHLRQAEPLTKEAQDAYFTQVIPKLFDQEKPAQILFSFLKAGVCIGYGGLVHINWIDCNAELSFIMNTEFEKNSFKEYWTEYLNLIEKVAYNLLSLHKIYVYAFDVRPHLYRVLESNHYFHDASLREHCKFQGKFIDVVIYSKIR